MYLTKEQAGQVAASNALDFSFDDETVFVWVRTEPVVLHGYAEGLGNWARTERAGVTVDPAFADMEHYETMAAFAAAYGLSC